MHLFFLPHQAENPFLIMAVSWVHRTFTEVLAGLDKLVMVAGEITSYTMPR